MAKRRRRRNRTSRRAGIIVLRYPVSKVRRAGNKAFSRAREGICATTKRANVITQVFDSRAARVWKQNLTSFTGYVNMARSFR